MHSPYTREPLEALMIAQTSVGLALTAVAWSRPSRPILSSCVLVATLWWVVLQPLQERVFATLGMELLPTQYAWSVSVQAMFVTFAALLSRRPRTVAFSAAAQIVIALLTVILVKSEWEISAATLALIGALIGIEARARDRDVALSLAGSPCPDRSFVAHDLAMFGLATLLAVGVSLFVLEQSIGSSDEWAYTFQAAVFAKGRAFAPAPPCSAAYRNFWVYEWMGRQFCQYTPGWPLFMAPFAVLGVPQFAAAPSLGLLVVAVARLSRRASRESLHAPDVVAAAGTIAALSTAFASTLLVNGGSRFGHAFAAALLAWGIEAMCAAEDASRGGSRRAQVAWSLVLGVSAAWLCATRPGEGTASAIGLALYGLYAIFRRSLTTRSVGTAALAAASVAAVTLALLRRQLGTWFKTGYGLTPDIHPWAVVKLVWPGPADLKWGIPLATGSYCWWPLSPAVGIAGLVMLRGRASRLRFMLALGAIALFFFCALINQGRGSDWAYGPRYVLSVVVPMAVGTGVALAPLWSRARRSRGVRGHGAWGPFVLATLAIAGGVSFLAPLVYPNNTEAIRKLNALNSEIERQGLHHAVVFVPTGAGWKNDGLDLTMNLPVTLYPDQDVIIALDKTPSVTRCVRDEHAGWTFYKALPGDPIQLTKD